MYSVRGRQITMVITLTVCVALRMPVAYAIRVQQFPNCTEFLRSQVATSADWVAHSNLYYIYDFHLLSIAQTMLPFIILVLFNAEIVRRLLTGGGGAKHEYVSKIETILLFSVHHRPRCHCLSYSTTTINR